ncbi:hypothetical protein [Lacinutrix jangbogonensis]|nr:hypothetical protein [Lacinutrix jangbogonensis]
MISSSRGIILPDNNQIAVFAFSKPLLLYVNRKVSQILVSGTLL